MSFGTGSYVQLERIADALEKKNKLTQEQNKILESINENLRNIYGAIP